MKGRCHNPRHTGYQRYGGRGISVCEEWRNSFTAFREWAFANGYDEDAPHGTCTLDRIDPDGNYAPDNCRWVDMRVQANNRSPEGVKRREEKALNNILIHIYGDMSHCHFEHTRPEEYILLWKL